MALLLFATDQAIDVAWPALRIAEVLVAVWLAVALGLNAARLILPGDHDSGVVLEELDLGVGTVGVSILMVFPALALLVMSLADPPGLVVAITALGAAGLCIRASGDRRESKASKAEPTKNVEPEQGKGWVSIDLTWDLHARLGDSAKGSAQTWISADRVEEARQKNPGTRQLPDGTLDLVSYVLEGRCEEVDNLVADLSQSSRDFGLDELLEIEMVLNLVQQIEYKSDEITKGVPDYWRFPIETLVDQAGDCEDTSILMASLMSGMGHKVAMLELPGHAAVGVAGLDSHIGKPFLHAGELYQFAETTGTGWGVGDYPEGTSASDITVAGVVQPLQGHKRRVRLTRDEDHAWQDGNKVMVKGTLLAMVLAVVVAGLAVVGVSN